MLYRTVRGLRRVNKRLKTDKKGSVAIEFSILAIPFLALVFATLETAFIFIVDDAMSTATEETARRIRTGNYQYSCSGKLAIKNNLCRFMKVAGDLGNCQENMRVDMVRAPDGKFRTTLLPVTTGSKDDAEAPPMLPSTYEDSGPGDVVIFRAEYYYKLALPGKLTGLANRGGNIRLLQATSVFRNEPFLNTCPDN